MIGGISAFSSAYSPYAASSARRAGGAEQPFAVPASALRKEEAPGVRDPAADSVQLSRDFPQLFANATYAPQPLQQLQRTAGAIQETSAAAQSGASGSRATPGLGAEMDAQAQGAQNGIPGDPGTAENAGTDEAGNAEDAKKNDPAEPDGADGKDMEKGEQDQVTELKKRDREVRAHEMAHQAVGGAYAGGASYEYQQGPDGQRYAVGGEVSIDMSAERDPEATIAKMQQVKAAAMAPAQPSGQDRSVAASATATEMQARSEVAAASASGGSGESGEEGAGEAGEAEGAGEAGSGSGAAGESQNAPAIPGMPETSATTGTDNNVRSANNSNGSNAPMAFRSNPYQNVSSASANVLNLPNAYRAIDIVA